MVYRSGTILTILVGSYLGNVPEKFESHWPNGLGEDSIYSKLFMLFYFELWQPFCYSERLVGCFGFNGPLRSISVYIGPNPFELIW